MSEWRQVSFLASLPMIGSAFRMGGDGAIRLQLEIPRSEKANAVPLLALDGCVLRVTVEVAEKDEREGGEADAGDSAQPGAAGRRSAKLRIG